MPGCNFCTQPAQYLDPLFAFHSGLRWCTETHRTELHLFSSSTESNEIVELLDLVLVVHEDRVLTLLRRLGFDVVEHVVESLDGMCPVLLSQSPRAVCGPLPRRHQTP